ncbi:MAG: nitrate reductase [Actinobacteria bacterium]|nr:nitrate reductase [Actinomycetota bacterium]
MKLRSVDGPLTRELLREPARFGLGQVPASATPDATTRMICGYCSTGCSLDVHLQDGEAVGLTPTADHPVNLGMACPKGWEALTPLAAPDRLTQPLLRNEHGKLVPVDWPTALDAFISQMRDVQQRHGAASTAFLSTGQIPTEEMALLGALTKFGMGMIHGDGNTRQCMATSVVAYKEAFGFDAPPYTYADFELSDTVVFYGSNPAIAHPIMWERVKRNQRGASVVVVDPRRTETAMAADLHLAIRPKSDLVLLYGLARQLLARDWVDWDFVRAHTNDLGGFTEHVEPYSIDRVCDETGLDPADFIALVDLHAPGRRVSSWWTMGVNQSHQGVRTAQAIINVALLTGNIGKPGTGANSITGQCNAMGSRLFSNTVSMFGGRDFRDAGQRAEVAEKLGIDVNRIPDQLSWSYDRIIEGIHRGEIKGLWIIATNTAHSWINQSDVRELLGKLELLVVQDLYGTTETAQRADLVLPAAGWGEKDGTFINSERRIGVIKRVARAPGQALTDFAIFKLIADAWGCGHLFEEWSSPEATFTLLARLSEGQPCDFSGIESYRMIDGAGGIQWPYPVEMREAEHQEGSFGSAKPPTDRRRRSKNERRLFEDGEFFHPDGRARFVFSDPEPPKERPSAGFPLVLLTGRGSSAEWHTNTRTGKSAVLGKLHPACTRVELHPDDAAARGISTNDAVTVRTRRGQIEARALVTPTVQEGQIFVPMHDASTNRLTFPSFDPHSRQPSYKHAAAEVTRVERS